MKRSAVRFLLCCLVLSLILALAATAAAHGAPLVFAPDTVASQISNDPSIYLWRDAHNHLWIATPFYVWDITDGDRVTVTDGGREYEWLAGEQAAGSRIVDSLFLAAQPGSAVTSRVFFALPDEAVVYLEHPLSNGVEGLELSFRASDGLIRLAHRWQGENAPAKRSSQAALALAGHQAAVKMVGILPAADTAPAGGRLAYSARFYPDSRQGYANLQYAEASEPAQPIAPPGLHASGQSTLPPPDEEQFPDFFLPGRVLSTEYLLFYHADPIQPLLPIETLALRLGLALPDLDAASIARIPRYDYDAAKNQPAAGDAVTFVARVANRGGELSGPFAYDWRVDGTVVQSNTYPGLSAGELITLTLGWTWQTGVHAVSIELDPGNLVSEVSEQNNTVEDRTNALAVGLWVEQSVYDYFNVRQVELGLGSVSWDDWAQRQMRVWNQMFATAISPLTPQGIIDRVRLDKVTVVADGMLPPCATNLPDPDDKMIDLEWGFPAEEVGVPSGHVCGAFNFYIDNPEVLNVEYSLMHELSHARYLIDLYGLNVHVNAAHLSTDIDSASTTLIVDRDIENDGNFPVPAYLAVAGELILCQVKSANTFSDCSRGGEGTTPRPHPSGTLVNLALVRLQDGAGNLIEGSAAMPVIGWEDHLYYSRYQDDVMNGGIVYRQYSAYAWNRIAGRRPVCGNYNAPCNIGEYLRDMPQANILEISGENGQPLHWAKVELHQPHPHPSIYGKLFLKDPDAVYTTDVLGQVNLGASPFGDLTWDVGPHKGLILLKISSAGQSNYQFFEITSANEAYWGGHPDRATYTITTTLQQGPPPLEVSLPIVMHNYSSVPLHTAKFSSQASDGEIGSIGYTAWDPCHNASEGNLVFPSFGAATVESNYQNGEYSDKRVFFYFDTSTLPVSVTITSAKLHFYAGPFQSGAVRRVHVVQAFQSEPLTGADFGRISFISGGFADLTTSTWTQIALSNTGLTWIVKGGVTKVALVHDLDLNNVTPDNVNSCNVSMSEDSTHQPYLVVQYMVP